MQFSVTQLGNRRPTWLAHSRLPWILLIFVTAGVASNLAADGDAVPEGSAGNTTAPQPVVEVLLREGSRFEARKAICRQSGDRLALTFEDSRVIEALPNLAAQRILQACRDDAADSQWLVSGKITEFQNHNYLLLDHVVRVPNAQ